MPDTYDPRQIREVLLSLGYRETINDDYGMLYLIRDQQHLWTLRLSRQGELDRLTVQEKCRTNDISFEHFDQLYKKAKKHKKLKSG